VDYESHPPSNDSEMTRATGRAYRIDFYEMARHSALPARE